MHLSPARILNFIRREAVLCCAALAALASTLLCRPPAAYISISTSALPRAPAFLP